MEATKTVRKLETSLESQGDYSTKYLSQSLANIPKHTENITNSNDGEIKKFRKLKTWILAAVLISTIIISWHLYEHFFYRENSEVESKIEYEIHELTKRLFDDEKQQKRYLAKIHFQHSTTVYDHDDRAPQNLIEFYNDFVTNETNTTTSLMRLLFDNYELDANVAEKMSVEKKLEEYNFLTAIMETTTMMNTMKFLQQKGFVSADHKLQMQLLYDLWFQKYSRGQGAVSSCGFESVFLAEINKHNILGLHNWIYFYEQEKAGKLNYKGYINKVDLGKKHDKHLLVVRFSFMNISKTFNALFVGTSPELELSLYTICFVASMNQDCLIHLGKSTFSIITHALQWHGKLVIGSAYPIIESDIKPTSRPWRRKKYTLKKNWVLRSIIPHEARHSHRQISFISASIKSTSVYKYIVISLLSNLCLFISFS